MPTDSIAGRSIVELLQEHAGPVGELRAKLGSDDPNEEDQVLLRMVLASNGDVVKAEETALKGREDRIKYAEVLDKAKRGEELPQAFKIGQHLCFGRWEYPAEGGVKDQPPLMITRSGRTNPVSLMDGSSADEVAEFFLWHRQRCWDEVISESKNTGLLVLMVSVNDLEGASLIAGREKRFFEAIGKSSEVGAGLFPLLTKKHVMVNSGYFIEMLFSLVSVFMPQRVLDKVAFMTVQEFFDAFGVAKNNFPDFLGGSAALAPDSPLNKALV